MVTGIIGQKIGMTQVFGTDGAARPVTVLKAGPCVVIQRKQVDRDGYEAVQLGLVEDRPARVTRPVAGLYARANVPPTRVRREVGLDGRSDAPAEGDQVDVVGVSRGHGFQGVMKRHGFGGGRATHGSMFHRAPGSIGQSSYPSRVLKGMRGPGRMGGDRVTVRNLRVVTVDAESNRLVVTGAVPGAAGAYVVIRRAAAPRREPAPPAVDEKKKKKR